MCVWGGAGCVVATHPLPLLRTHNQSGKDDTYSSFSGCLQGDVAQCSPVGRDRPPVPPTPQSSNRSVAPFQWLHPTHSFLRLGLPQASQGVGGASLGSRFPTP